MGSNEGILYQHYKGNLYVVLHRGEDVRNEKDMAPVVVYQSCENGIIWVRAEEEFFGEVTLPSGGIVKRFREYNPNREKDY